MDFTRNEQMGCSEVFLGNANCAKHPLDVPSHVRTPMNVSGENMSQARRSQKGPRKAKIEGYNTAFDFPGAELRMPHDFS